MMYLETTSWTYFIKLLFVLVILYLLFQILPRVLFVIFKRKSTRQKIAHHFSILKRVYVPLAILLAVVTFVSINYTIHGILIGVLFLFLFPSLKNYFNGLILKFNPVITKGAYLVTNDFDGEIETLGVFGIQLKSDNAERYIPYSILHANTFKISHKVDSSIKKTIHLANATQKEKLMDALFESPLVNFTKKPSFRIENNNELEVQFTLEQGAKLESVLDYLKQQNIDITTNQN